MKYEFHMGDCLETLRTLPDNSVDSVVTDPPYGLSFMGKRWDYDVPGVDVWAECLRVLKPGGHLLAFAGTRTQHRMAVRIEDAGFDIRDMIAWVYSSGFPKSHNLDRLRGEKTCNCEPSSECDVRAVRSGDVSASVDTREGRGQVLQSCLSEQGAPVAGRSKLSCAKVRGGESSMEGRRDASAASRELRFSAVHPRSGACPTDDPEGRLRDGAPLDHGGVDRQDAASARSGAPRRSRSAEQRSDEPGAVAGQPEPQALGAWPVCGGCGLPRVSAGLGTALKPALEPITVARKPLIGTVAANVLEFGTGAMNIADCRVAPTGESRARSGEASQDQRYTEAGATNFAAKPGVRGGDPAGRWPANLIHDGSAEVVALFPDAPGQQGASSDNQRTRANCYGALSHGGKQYTPRADSGSAARFFYCAKASKRDRDEGCAHMATVTADPYGQHRGRRMEGNDTRIDGKPPAQGKNFHPTVKPTDLMAYLCRLVTPPGGVVLAPFMGSGSTGKAAMREGFQFIGCELDPEYLAIAKARIDHEIQKNQMKRGGR